MTRSAPAAPRGALTRLASVRFASALAAVALVACPSAPPAPAPPAPASSGALSCGDGADGSPIVARLGAVQVSEADLEAAILRLPVRARSRYEAPGPRRTLAGRIVEERILCRAALAAELDASAVAARAAEEAVAARYVDSVETAAVSEDAIRAFYDANPDRYRMAVVDASHMILGSREMADAMARELRAGADFASLAMQHSTDSRSAQAGGRLGWIAKGRMDPAWTEAAFALEPGQISDPVRTAYGWALIRVAERKDTQPLDDVRAGIVRRLRGDASASLLGELFAGEEVVFEGPLREAAGSADPTP